MEIERKLSIDKDIRLSFLMFYGTQINYNSLYHRSLAELFHVFMVTLVSWKYLSLFRLFSLSIRTYDTAGQWTYLVGPTGRRIRRLQQQQLGIMCILLSVLDNCSHHRSLLRSHNRAVHALQVCCAAFGFPTRSPLCLPWTMLAYVLSRTTLTGLCSTTNIQKPRFLHHLSTQHIAFLWVFPYNDKNV